MFESLFGGEIHQLFKIVIRFAREPSDHRRPHDQVVDARSQVAHDFFLQATCGLARHAFEHLVTGMLQWHVDVRQNPFRASKRIDQAIIDVHRIKIHQPNPVNRFDLIEFHQ